MSNMWLQDAARLARHALLARIDLEMGGRPFFWVDFRKDPPQASHSYWDHVDIAGRYVDALVLARALTGSHDGLEAEAMLREFLWNHQNSKNGLFYTPEETPQPSNEVSKYAMDGTGGMIQSHVDMFCQRAPLLAMPTLLASGDESVRLRLQNLVTGLTAISEREGDEIRFPTYRWAPILKPEWYASKSGPERWLGYRYALLTGLARYVELSDYPAATELAMGLARYYMHHGDVGADGRFHGNTHSGGILPTAVGIAHLGAWTGDEAMLEWAHRVYTYVREQTPDFGFLVDGLGLDGVFSSSCETCGIADLLHLAIVLTEAGAGDYWDDIERFARNQLLENQYRDADALRRAFPGISDRVVNMLWGAFEAAARPNELLTWDGSEGCCIGGGLRALYLTWRAAVTETGRETRVNLGFSRSTPFADVAGHEPWEGRIDVRVRSPRRVLIRVPDHAALSEVVAFVNDSRVEVPYDGRYAVFQDLESGQMAAITYPLRESSRSYRIGGIDYRGQWRGSTMLEIQPPGDRYPIYRRRETVDGADARDRRRVETIARHSVSAPVLW